MFSNNFNDQLYYISPMQEEGCPYGVRDFSRDQHNEYLREYELRRALEQQVRQRQLQQLREYQIQELREQQFREQAYREQQLREQRLREQQLREQQLRLNRGLENKKLGNRGLEKKESNNKEKKRPDMFQISSSPGTLNLLINTMKMLKKNKENNISNKRS